MLDTQKVLKNFPEYISYYWNYQYRLGSEYIVPYFIKKGISLKDKQVLEIGAGEGGVLMAISEKNVKLTVGFDLRTGVVDTGNEISKLFNLPCEFHVHNMYDEKIPDEWKNKFDLIIMRDVIEHLDNTPKNIETLLKFAHKDTLIYITFPPYYSAFGAHQHTLASMPGKIPFIQLLPNSLFSFFTSFGREADKIEVKRLRNIRLTINKFRRAVYSVGLEIVDEKLYLLRPVFKIKFGIPPIAFNILRHIPLLRELIAMEAGYLLKVK
jgi:hypothetical protein